MRQISSRYSEVGWTCVGPTTKCLQKSRVRRGNHTFPSFLFGTNVPTLKNYHTTRFCEASISYKLFVQPRAAGFPMKKIDFVKQSNASRLFVADVQTFEFSDESGLCEALKLFRLFVKSRTASFPIKRIEAAPLNPAKRFILETQAKRRKRKTRCYREKTKSLTLETQHLEAKPTQLYDRFREMRSESSLETQTPTYIAFRT